MRVKQSKEKSLKGELGNQFISIYGLFNDALTNKLSEVITLMTRVSDVNGSNHQWDTGDPD
jgi:hypothetical protein